MSGKLFIGLMSGTSLDGVDAVLARFGDATTGTVNLLGHQHQPFDESLRQELLALNTPGDNELHRSALAANALSAVYAAAVATLLQRAQLPAESIAALGAHGQTVRHRPGEFDRTGYTVQLLNGARLAELSGIDVVCDFRSRDVAAGGQGAPLVPAFHQAMFDRPGLAQAILNIGGIANLTLLDGLAGVRGFDCGPGNALLDHWCSKHRGEAFDTDGQWASGGTVNGAVLARMLSEPYFKRQPPKSTGRDLFNSDWLASTLNAAEGSSAGTAQDVQATLAELTAVSVCDALDRHLPAASRLLICGGGSFNADLVRRMQRHRPELPMASTSTVGVDAMQIEAAAFAWLAQRHILRQSGNCQAVTGALGTRVLGCCYPAR